MTEVHWVGEAGVRVGGGPRRWQVRQRLVAVAGLQGRRVHLGRHGAGQAGREGGRAVLPPAQAEVRHLLEGTHCQIRVLQTLKGGTNRMVDISYQLLVVVMLVVV